MDPITLIVTAIATGAAVAATEVATEAVRDAYAGFKALVIRNFGSTGAVEASVQQVEANPDSEVWQNALSDGLTQAGADADQAVISLANNLLDLIAELDRSTGSTYTATLKGSGAIAQDHSVAAGEGGTAVQGDVHGPIIHGSRNIVGDVRGDVDMSDRRVQQKGKYNINIGKAEGIAIGDQAQVVQHFGGESEPSPQVPAKDPSKTFGNAEESAPDQIYGEGNRWAVLVGVNAYEDNASYGPLKLCVQDVEAIQRQLITGGYDPARIRLLTDNTPEKPTRANILTALQAVANATEEDDLLLFYYSGHGSEKDGESYLVASDGRHLTLGDTAVPITRIKEIMQAAPARAKVIILDACHSGANIGNKGPEPMSPEFIQRVFEQAEGMAILSSCKKDQLSWEWFDKKQGVFTYYLLEALTGEADRDEKGFISVQDASRHVTNGVKLWASQRNRSQTPTLEYKVAGDIILTKPD